MTSWHYRVGVGSATGAQSGVWRFWTWKDDIYLSLRSIGHVMKVSLHQSGVWQAGLTSEAARARNIDFTTRAWDRWRRPPELAMGTVKAFQIIVPASEVTQPRVLQPTRGKVEWLPRPTEGYCTYITALHGSAQAPGFATFLVGDAVARLLSHVELPSGAKLWVVSHDEVLTEGQATQLHAMKSRSTHEYATIENELRDAAHPRFGVFGSDSDGARFIIDISVPDHTRQ